MNAVQGGGTEREVLKMGQHKTSILWERDTEHFNIKSFNRDHVIRFENGVVIHATSAPEFTGNPDLISPDDLFVATISSCHIMTFLAVASLNKRQVQTYRDPAQGFLEENQAGRIMMNRVILQPQVVFSGSNHPSRKAQEDMHLGKAKRFHRQFRSHFDQHSAKLLSSWLN